MKNLNNAITELYKNNTIPNLIKRISKKHIPPEDVDELTQYIFLQLLENKENTLTLVNDDNRQRINYYLVRMIQQQLYSNTSWYHYNVRRWKERNASL